MGNWEIHIKDEPYFDRVQVYMIRVTPHGLEMLQPDMDTVVTIPKGGAITEKPTITFSKLLFQEFVNAISKHGYKAVDGGFIEGKLAATEEHLKDMRKLVFDQDLVLCPRDVIMKTRTEGIAQRIIK